MAAESEGAVPPILSRVSLVFSLVVLLLGVAPGAQAAEVCLRVDESHDSFSANDRAAALVLLAREFEREGQQVVAGDCANAYVVSHVRFGTTIIITMTGPAGEREATARGMDDVPAVYSQMVRSLVRGVPMDTRGVVDRTNVSNRQSDAPNRVYSDSLIYFRLGYSGVIAEQTHNAPSVTLLGYRHEMDRIGIDVSLLNYSFSGSDTYRYPYDTQKTARVGTWLKLEFLRFLSSRSSTSPYVGGGLSWTSVELGAADAQWDGNGLQGEVSFGYEFGRSSTIRSFLQVDGGLPFYKLDGTSYGYNGLYGAQPSTDSRWCPSVSVSVGVGWQRGRK
jgi:hypothetical protein